MMEESFVISSQGKLLENEIKEINKFYEVKIELQGDPNCNDADGIQWVSIKGKDNNDVTDAKTHIISLCNPELKEHISFPGFPLIIFAALEERVKRIVQRELGIVLSLTDDGFIDIHGSNVGVIMAISKFHHLHKMNRDRDNNKAREEALQFDNYIEKEGGGYQDELKTLSNVLKKEILQILGVQIQPVNGETIPKVLKLSEDLVDPSLVPGPSKNIDPEVIHIEDSIVVIDSDEDDDSEEDDEQEDARAASLSDCDGIGENANYMLPPNFVIREWIKVHYEGTNDPTDFVNKNNMLDHFRKHFDLQDHPELANTFFNKLAMRIFPQDPNYRSVKTKKTKSKRRLVCLRRRTLSDSDNNDISLVPGAAMIAPPHNAASILPPHKPPEKTASPTRQNSPKITQQVRQPPQQQNAMMKKWNSNRMGLDKPSIPPHKPPEKTASPTRQNSLKITPQVRQPPQQQNAMMKKSNSNRMGLDKPSNSIQRPPHNPPPIEQWQYVPIRPALSKVVQPPSVLGEWLNSAPVPKPRTQPKVQRQPNGIMNTLARRVSEMSNKELVNKKRPAPDPKLRHIIIDGSNVAMSHGNHSNFSCRGIALCARFFIERGHKNVTCFVPNYRKGGGGNPPSSDAYLLIQLEEMGILKSTPSRRIGGQNIVCYDDRFIVELAGATNGVILSNDQYRDLMAQDRKWRPIVEQQLLQYTIVGDLLMLPEDPLGRDGPPLEDFLMIPRNGRKSPLQPKVVKVPARSQPLPTPANTKPPLLPTPYSPFTTASPQTQHAAVTGAWMSHGKQPVVLSPDQHLLAYEMLKVLPDKECEINRVITDHPLIRNIEELMNILLISDTGT